MTGANVRITAADGHELGAYLARPPGRPRGGLVVIQEAFGVNAYLRSVCDSYAADGYAAIAPALYDRQQRDAAFDYAPASLPLARGLRAGLVWEHTLADVAAALEQVSACGRVGVVGFCVGGSVAWLAAATLPLAAVSAYYGRDVADFLDRAPRCPIILHFGLLDRTIPMAQVHRICTVRPEVPTYLYKAAHAFDGAGKENYHAESADLARERSLALFREHIG